jgi:hypothetical protein
MKNNIYISLALAGICFLTACKRMDSTYEKYIVPGGIVYPGKATAPTLKSGLNRVQISWKRGTDPKVVKARVYWNNYTDSLEIPVPADQDMVTCIVPNLTENYYSFIIKTFDKDGHVSVPVEVSGNAYAERYRSTLLNRVILSSTLNVANTLTIQFEPVLAGSTIAKSEVVYTNTAGEVKTVTVLKGVNSVQLTDYKKETTYALRTQYVDPNQVDAFYSNDQVTDGFLLNKTEWKVVAYSSYNSGDTPVGFSAPANMIDGNPATRWLTLTTLQYPHFITIDLAAERSIRTISLWRWVQATADERGPDVVKFEGSSDNSTWTALGTYNFNRLTNNEQVFNIPNTPKARYIKLTAISGPMAYVILGEINVSVK